ncbi:site-specific DNA-methyltransferase [Mycoplasma sp. HF14]
MNKEKKEIILNWLKDKEESDSLSLEEREVFASIKELLHTKKYGLVFEEKEEDIVKLTNESILTLTQKDSILVDENKKLNYLIEGDNYQSLKLLLKTHRNRIDVIYIDPPYNTGARSGDGGFVYNDSFVDAEDGFRHSKWLSFMKARLQIAKELLADDGMIFISIDDNEQAQLKMLCDEIFGERNFISNLIWNKHNAQNDAKFVERNHEYILFYAKNIESLIINKNEENLDIKKEFSLLLGNTAGGLLNNRNKMGQTVYWNPNNNDLKVVVDYDLERAKTENSDDIYTDNMELIEKGYIPIRPKKYAGRLGCWKWSPSKMIDEIERLVVSKTKDGEYTLKYKDIRETRTINPKSIINNFSSSSGSTLVNKLGIKFNNPKNINLLQHLLYFHPNTNGIVLDFFAGSGSTAHAVLNLNSETDSNRSFILCTNNENNICEDVTYKRVKNIQEELPHNLIYNKVETISKEEFISSYYSKEYKNKLQQSCFQLAQLELGKLIDNEEILFATSQKEFDSYSCKKLLNSKVIFVADSNVDYYGNKVFDEIKNKIVVIPDKYYSKELTEVGYLW